MDKVELSFMTYIKDVETADREWVKERQAEDRIEGRAEGKIEVVNKLVGAKFGVGALTLEVSDRLSQLNESQLDEFTTKIFQWQTVSEMLVWLNGLLG